MRKVAKRRQDTIMIPVAKWEEWQLHCQADRVWDRYICDLDNEIFDRETEDD